ncbi:MAG: RNA polymerase sigma factor [Candidatus Zixiibacteriota bacterium]
MSTQNGYKERFVELFDENKHKLYDYARRMLNDRDSAGDITQEAFIRLYNNLKNNHAEIKSPRNWLFIIARNLCLNKIRDSKKEINLEMADGHDELKYIDLDPKHIQLDKAMNSLDAQFREVLIMKEYHGFSYEEMASILHINVPAVRTLLYKARIALRDNFKIITTGR